MVLIVDDHHDTCKALEVLLRIRGLNSKCVTDPVQAFDEIVDKKPAVLILDQVMPGMLGTDLLKRVRSIPEMAHATVVMYSADYEVEAEARRLGAVWLHKG